MPLFPYSTQHQEMGSCIYFKILKSYKIIDKTKLELDFICRHFLCITISFMRCFQPLDCPVGWGCRIHRLLLCRGLRPPPQWVSCYDTKQSNGEVPVMLELWRMWSIPSLPLLPGPLWPGVVAPDRALSMC